MLFPKVMFVNRGRAPTDAEMYDAFNVARASGDALESAFRDSKAAVTAEEVAAAEKVLVKGVAKLLRRLRRLGGAAYQYAKAMVAHIISWAKKSDLSTVPLDRAVDMEVREFFVLVNNLGVETFTPKWVPPPAHPIHVKPPTLKYPVHLPASVAKKLESRANAQIPALVTAVQKATYWRNVTDKAVAAAVVEVVTTAEHRGALVYYKTAAALLEALKPRETISPRSAGVAAGVVSRFMKRAIQYINGYNAKSLTTYKVSRWAQKLRPSKQNLRSASRAMKKHWAEWKEETARIQHEKKTKADEADHFKKMHADEKRQKDEVKRKEDLDHESQVKKVKEHTKKIYSERTSKMSESDRKHHAREKGRKAGFKLRAELRHKERVKRRMAREKARKARRKMREAARKARKAARAHERRFKDEREKERQREHAQWFARIRKVQQAHLKKYHLQLKALSSAYAKRLDGIKKRFKAAVAKVHAEHSKWLEDEAARQRELEAKWTLLKNRIQRENEQRGKMLEMWADKRIAQINEEAEKQAVAMYNQTFAEVYASTRGTDAEKHEAAVKAATLAGQREKENVLARLLAAHYAELSRRKGSSRDLYEKLLKQLQKQFNAMKAKMLKRHKAAFMKRQQQIHLARKEALKQQAFILKAKQKREAAISKLKADYQAFLGKIRGQVVQYKQEIERTAKREALIRRMASQKRWQKLQQHRMAAWKKLRDARLKQWEEWKKLREKDNELRFKAIKKHNDRVEHLKKLMQMRLHRRQVKHRESLRKRQREHRGKERRSKHHGKRRSELYRKRKARAERRRKRYVRHLHELKQLHEKAWKKHTRQFHRQEQRMKTRDKRRQARLKLESKRKALRRKRRENRIKRRLAHERHTKESKTKRVQAKVQRKEHHMKQADKDRLKKVEEDRKRQWEEYQAQRKSDLEKIKDGISKSISEHAKLMKEKWEKLQKDSKGQWKTYSQQKAAIIAAEQAAQEAQQKQLKEQMESINKLVAEVQNATGDKLKQQTDRLNREIKKVERKFEKNVKDVTKTTKKLIKKVVVPKKPSPLPKPTGLTAALAKQLKGLKKALSVIKKNVAKPVTLPKGPEVPRPNLQLQKSLGGLMVVYPKGRGKIRPVPTQPFIAPPPRVPSRPAPRPIMVGGPSSLPPSYRTLVPRTVVLPVKRRDVRRVKVHHHVDYRRKPIGLPFIHPIAPRPQVLRKPRSHKPHRITIINKVQVNNRCSGSASASPGCANRNKPTALPRPHLPAKYSFKVYSARFAAFKKARASYKKAVRRFKKGMKSVNRRTRLRAAKAFKAAKKRFLKIYSSYKQYYHIRRRVLRRYRRKLRAYRRRQAEIQSWGLSAASAVKKVVVGGKKHKKDKKLKKTCASKLKKLKTSIKSAQKKYKVLRRASQCSSATCRAIKSKANAAAGQFKRLASKYFKLRSKCK